MPVDRHPAAGQPRVYLNGATIMSTTTRRSIEIAREAGFDGVEIRAERLIGSATESAEGVAIVRAGEVWSLNGIQLQVDDQGALDAGHLDRELAPRLAICRDFGAANLLVVPPRRAGVATDAAIAAMQRGLRVARDRAAEVGVGIAFELLGFADCPINTLALAAEVVAGVDGVGLVLDSCHWHASGAESLAGYPVERLVMVHLNDAPALVPRQIEDGDRVMPGDGVIDLARLLGDLRARAYAGPYSLETFNVSYWAKDPLAVAQIGREAVARLFAAAVAESGGAGDGGERNASAALPG